MAYIIDFENYSDEGGTLTVIDKVLPFEIKISYYITGVNHLSRGGHRHNILVEAIICINGGFTVYVDDGNRAQEIIQDNPHQCLIVEAGEWRSLTRSYLYTEDDVWKVIKALNNF